MDAGLRPPIALCCSCRAGLALPRALDSIQPRCPDSAEMAPWVVRCMGEGGLGPKQLGMGQRGGCSLSQEHGCVPAGEGC